MILVSLLHLSRVMNFLYTPCTCVWNNSYPVHHLVYLRVPFIECLDIDELRLSIRPNQYTIMFTTRYQIDVLTKDVLTVPEERKSICQMKLFLHSFYTALNANDKCDHIIQNKRQRSMENLGDPTSETHIIKFREVHHIFCIHHVRFG